MSATPVIGSFEGLRDVKLVGRQVHYEQLSFWLNPVGAAFTVGFSVVFLILLGASAGNSRISFYGDIRLVQYYVPGFAAYGVMAACFNILAITLVNRREMGLLRRLRLSPLPTWALLTAIVVSSMVISAVEVIILLVVGRVGFSVHFPDNLGAFVVAIVVGMLCFSALGVAMSTLVPNQDAAGPIVSIIFFVLLFLSGLWFPLKPGSGLAQFSSYFPVRHFISAVFAPFNTERGASPWAWHDLLVVAVWGVVGAIVAARRWQWSPRRG
ncbi:MAG: ABC transporter permease [Acidimicrobiales bacterium]